MSVQDYVFYEADCPECGQTLYNWQTFDGPGECAVYDTVAELMKAANRTKVSIQCDHKCNGHWGRALANFEATVCPQLVGEIWVIE